MVLILGVACQCVPNHRGNSSISSMRPSFYPFLKEIDILGVLYRSVGSVWFACGGGVVPFLACLRWYAVRHQGMGAGS